MKTIHFRILIVTGIAAVFHAALSAGALAEEKSRSSAPPPKFVCTFLSAIPVVSSEAGKDFALTGKTLSMKTTIKVYPDPEKSGAFRVIYSSRSPNGQAVGFSTSNRTFVGTYDSEDDTGETLSVWEFRQNLQPVMHTVLEGSLDATVQISVDGKGRPSLNYLQIEPLDSGVAFARVAGLKIPTQLQSPYSSAFVGSVVFTAVDNSGSCVSAH